MEIPSLSEWMDGWELNGWMGIKWIRITWVDIEWTEEAIWAGKGPDWARTRLAIGLNQMPSGFNWKIESTNVLHRPLWWSRRPPRRVCAKGLVVRIAVGWGCPGALPVLPGRSDAGRRG